MKQTVQSLPQKIFRASHLQVQLSHLNSTEDNYSSLPISIWKEASGASQTPSVQSTGDSITNLLCLTLHPLKWQTTTSDSQAQHRSHSGHIDGGAQTVMVRTTKKPYEQLREKTSTHHVNRRHYPAPREANDKALTDVNGSSFKPQFRLNLRRSIQVVVFVFPFTLSVKVSNSILTKSFACLSASCLSLCSGIQVAKLFIDMHRLVHDFNFIQP